MGKNKKTRQEKIILQLKRQLTQEGTKFEPSQEAILKKPQAESLPNQKPKNHDISIFSYNLKLIKKDLLKTLILALIIISVEVMLYLRLK